MIILLSSCRKDKREFTSDFPHGYKTEIIIHYYESTNTTRVAVGFSIPDSYNYIGKRGILLPPEGYLKINGVEVIAQPGYTFYEQYFDGKPTCLIEFKDYDGTIYKNTMIPPDTAYFINVPDTVSSLEDFQLQVNAPILDSNESSEICLNGCGDDYGDWLYFGTDSLISPYYYPTLESGMNHILYLNRSKHLSNPILPFAGGSVVYYYVAEKAFYTP